jgi:type III secretion protein V
MDSRAPTAFLTRYSDIALAAVVIGMVGMMIVPLPTFLLDLLLTLNISAAVVLLLVSLYVPTALKISAFPAILLITTLFRLALNVSSTRLILLQADAGEVIDAFGNFVVQGNYVVGAVVFLILTIVQFLVIAKGAERVSEVAARFTLDAMPGKQMAIDADLRAGAFDLDEARRRRAEIQRESQLYGAMDGAMKFVKGDAIAGVIITSINIIAGMIIGVAQLEMPAVEAAQTYTILTIGDGLVSQIPALLIATTAGIIVTRVASEEGDTHLGADIAAQLAAHPRAIAIAGALLIGLAIIPGLPTVPFLMMGGAVGFVAWRLHRFTLEDIEDLEREQIEEVEDTAREGARQVRRMIPAVTPLTVQFGEEITAEINAERQAWLDDMMPTMREALFHELGIKVPAIRFRRKSPVGGREFVFCIDEIPVDRGEFPRERALAAVDDEELGAFGFEGVPTRNPATRRPATWVEAAHVDRLEEAGVQTWDAAGYILLRLTAMLRSHADDFVDIQTTQGMLDQLEGPYPAVVHEVVPGVVGVQELAEILRRLVAEGISIRNLKRILEILAERGKGDRDPIELTEVVREGLSRLITNKYSGADGAMSVYLVDKGIEEMVAGAIRVSEQGTYLALPPEVTREILDAVGENVRGDVERGRTPVLLTDQRVRRYLKRLVSIEVPDVVVLAFQELEPALQVQPVGRIKVGGG